MTSTVAKLVPACDERQALALTVANAVTKVHETRKKYAAAAEDIKSKNTGAAYDSIVKARAAEQKALQGLREHIEQHGCSV